VCFCVVLGGFPGVMRRVQSMSVRDLRVVRGFFVVSFRMVLGGSAVVLRGLLVVLGGFYVMFGGFVAHSRSSFVEKTYGNPSEF
jgi:hypothetical protein